jgi:hypothetical protein
MRFCLNPAIWETNAATGRRWIGCADMRRSRAVPVHDRGEIVEGGGGSGESGAEAADDSVLAQDHHCIEERWSDGLADDGDTGGIDQKSGFHSGGFRNRAGGVIAGVVIPLAQLG